MKRWCCHLGFLLIFFSGSAFGEKKISIKDVQTEYQKILSFHGNFFQKNYLVEGNMIHESSGMVDYQRPGKMRWDYQKPNPQLLVTDGKTFWLYDPLLENVTVAPLSKVTEGTPLTFLLGLGQLTESFDAQSVTRTIIEDPKLVVLQLKPKKPLAGIQFIQLGIDSKKNLSQIILVDQQGNYRQIGFSQMKYNPSFSEDRFIFKVTPGMEIISENE